MAVTVPPQQYLVDRIGADLVKTTVLLPPGSSPHSYEPSPVQMIGLSTAKLYVKVGHPMLLLESKHVDPFLQRNPQIRVVRMHDGSIPQAATAEDREALMDDPHVWVAPVTMRKGAEDIGRALREIDPAHAAIYDENLRKVLDDIDSVDREIRAQLAGVPRKHFMVYHPAWGYFASEYGLIQIPIERGDKEPGPRQIVELVEQAKREHIRVIFVQTGFAQKSAEVVANEAGARVVALDPLAYDWVANMRVVAKAFRGALVDD